MSDRLVIAGLPLRSRLLVGSSGYPNQQVMLDSLEASGAELVTVAIRRISLTGYSESLVDVLGDRYRLLPNTAGCSTARHAGRIPKRAHADPSSPQMGLVGS